MITDGVPTDMKIRDSKWSEVINRIHYGQAEGKFLFFIVGVEPADMTLLEQLAPPNTVPLKLKQNRFKEMFKWLSSSQTKVSQSTPGDDVTLDNPQGWGQICTR